MVPILEMYARQKVSHKVFVEAFTWVHNQALKANVMLLNFQIILNSIIKFEASRRRDPTSISMQVRRD